jgi:hypothetical protein
MSAQGAGYQALAWLETQYVHPTDPRQEAPERREGDIASRKFHVACRACNSGWMSNDIEQPAISALRPLLIGETAVITGNMQRAIARWAALKCMVVEQDDKPYAAVPLAEIRRFRETLEPPTGFQIWIGHFTGLGKVCKTCAATAPEAVSSP